MKVCPLKFNSNTLDKDGEHLKDTCRCEEEDCALWESHTGTCALLTEACILDFREILKDRGGIND